MPTKDTPEKMARMHAWLDAVARELDLDPAVMAEAERPLLSLIGKIAHGPSRPGAPLSAYLIGYAVAKGAAPSQELIAKIDALVASYEYEADIN